MRNSVNPKKIVNIIQKKEYLTFFNKEKAFSVKVKPFHLYKIMQKVGKSMTYAIDFISLVRINQTEKEEKSFGQDQEEVLERFLNRKKEFLVLPKWDDSMDENEKLVIGIDLRKKHLQKINSMMGNRWVDIMNFLQLSLVQQSHEELKMKKKNSLMRKKSMNTYLGLIRNLNSLKASFPNKKMVDLPGNSFDKIQKLSEISVNDIINSIGIQILGSDNKTIASRCKLFEKSLFEKAKEDEVKDTDVFGFFPIEQGSKYFQKVNLDSSGANDFNEALKTYQNLQKSIAKKKEEINKYCSKSINNYYEIENMEGKKCFVNKCYFEMITQSNESLPEKFKIKDSKENYYEFKTEDIKNLENNESKNEYIKLKVPYSDNEAIFNKSSMLMILEEIKSYKFRYQIDVTEFEEKNYIETTLEEIILPEQNEINKASIESQISAFTDLLDKKNNMLNQLKKEQCFYIEYEDEKLFNDSIVPQVENYKDNLDIFYIQNKSPNAEKPKFKANKNEIITKGKDPNLRFVKVLHNDAEIIISKKELEKAIETWDENESNFEITEYNADIGKGQNIFDLNDIEIVEIVKEDLPLQVFRDNERIKNELKNDVNFLKTNDIKKNPILVREKLQKIISELSPKSDIYDVYTKTRIDNRNLNKIYTADLENPDNVKFVELNIDQGNNFISKAIVKRKMLEDRLEDEENDDVLLEDEFGAPLSAKKSTIHVFVPPEIRLPPQSREQKEEIMKKLEKTKTFMLVENEEPKDKFIRSEYVQLITKDEPKTPFDRYEIPDEKGNKVYVSKAYLQNKLVPEENEFVKATIKGNPHFILKKDLTVEPFNSTYTALMDDRIKADVVFNDLDILIINDEIKSLPDQPEENLVGDLNNKKKELSTYNDEKELACANNSEGNQVFFARKYMTEITQNLREKDEQGNYTIKDYKEKETKIPSDEIKNFDENNRYIPIKIRGEEDETDIVNKIDLATKFNKLNTPREYARVISAIDKKKPLSVSSQNLKIKKIKGYEPPPPPKPKEEPVVNIEPKKEEENKLKAEEKLPPKEETKIVEQSGEEERSFKPKKPFLRGRRKPEAEEEEEKKEEPANKEDQKEVPKVKEDKKEDTILIPKTEEKKKEIKKEEPATLLSVNALINENPSEQEKSKPILRGAKKPNVPEEKKEDTALKVKENENEKKPLIANEENIQVKEEEKDKAKPKHKFGVDAMKNNVLRNIDLQSNFRNRNLNGKRVFIIRRAIIKRTDV